MKLSNKINMDEFEKILKIAELVLLVGVVVSGFRITDEMEKMNRTLEKISNDTIIICDKTVQIKEIVEKNAEE